MPPPHLPYKSGGLTCVSDRPAINWGFDNQTWVPLISYSNSELKKTPICICIYCTVYYKGYWWTLAEEMNRARHRKEGLGASLLSLAIPHHQRTPPAWLSGSSLNLVLLYFCGGFIPRHHWWSLWPFVISLIFRPSPLPRGCGVRLKVPKALILPGL